MNGDLVQEMNPQVLQNEMDTASRHQYISFVIAQAFIQIKSLVSSRLR